MHVLIVRNNSNPQALDASLMLVAYFSAQGIECVLADSSDLGHCGTRERVAEALAQGVALAVVLGGDGTILHTARLLAGESAPILGINFGRLGFLANASDGGVVDIVSRALAGELSCERRTNLQVDVVCDGEPDPFDDERWDSSVLAAGAQGHASAPARTACAPARTACAHAGCAVEDVDNPPFGVNCDGLRGERTFFALNEVALTRGAMGRIVEFSLDISDNRIANMRGDGMVVATATGSTAYALSAGGPLVAPGFTGLIALPLAPHTLRARALLTGESDVVCITLVGKELDREATLFVDGDMVMFDRPVSRIYVRRGDVPTTLLRTPGENFYEYAAKTFF